jgi:hypothetical protein
MDLVVNAVSGSVGVDHAGPTRLCREEGLLVLSEGSRKLIPIERDFSAQFLP